MYFWPFFETAKLTIFRFCQTINFYKMQNTFEQLTEILEKLELTCKNGLSLPDIERDIVLEKLRKIYTSLKSGIPSLDSPEEQKYGVYQGLEEDVNLFFDTEHESYATAEKEPHPVEQAKVDESKVEEEKQKKLADEQREKMKRITEELRRKEAEEEQKRLAEEQRRKEEEQKRLAEERRRKEEEQKRLAEEQRRKEEEQKRLAEEQRRKEEEQKRLAEEQRRREEEKKRTQPVDEDDLLQFMPKSNVSNKPQQRSLNDLFTPEGNDRSLGAQYQNAKVTDLTKAISINDKFTYIKELFNNKGEEFSAAITQLNQCRNMDEAFNTLETLKQKHFWDSTSTTYLSLCDLLRRKFN